ncbi:MAG: thiol peroxidase [Alistipes putredinis]
MSITKFKGQPVQIAGEFVKAGAAAPDFELVKTDLSTLSLKDLRGKQVILNIFPSLDTGVCAASVRKFNKLAAGACRERSCWLFRKTCLSLMRVFARSRGIENVVPVSDFRKTSFDESYGVLMTDGPLKGLLARSVVVIDGDGKVVYTELVPEITQEPDYDKALAAVKR